MVGPENPVSLFRFNGGVEKPPPLVRGNHPVPVSVEDEERRVDLVDLGDRIETVLDQVTGRNEWILRLGGVA